MNPVKTVWRRFAEPVLMLAAAALSAVLILVLYAVFATID